ASDNVLSISLTQFNALGSVTLTQADTVTLLDTGATISGLSASTIASLATAGIDAFNASDNVITFTVAQYAQMFTSSVAFTANDQVTLFDTGANLETVDFTRLAANHVVALDASDDTLTLTRAQYVAIAGSVALTAGDFVTLADTGANLENLNWGVF